MYWLPWNKNLKKLKLLDNLEKLILVEKVQKTVLAMQRSNIEVTAFPGIIAKPKYSVKKTLDNYLSYGSF